jgi:hypothetical protein
MTMPKNAYFAHNSNLEMLAPTWQFPLQAIVTAMIAARIVVFFIGKLQR